MELEFGAEFLEDVNICVRKVAQLGKNRAYTVLIESIMDVVIF